MVPLGNSEVPAMDRKLSSFPGPRTNNPALLTCSFTAMTTELRSLSISFSMMSFFRVKLNSLENSEKDNPVRCKELMRKAIDNLLGKCCFT